MSDAAFCVKSNKAPVTGIFTSKGKGFNFLNTSTSVPRLDISRICFFSILNLICSGVYFSVMSVLLTNVGNTKQWSMFSKEFGA